LTTAIFSMSSNRRAPTPSSSSFKSASSDECAPNQMDPINGMDGDFNVEVSEAEMKRLIQEHSSTPARSILKRKVPDAPSKSRASSSKKTIIEEREPESFLNLGHVIRHPTLALDSREMDRKSGLVRIPLLYDESQGLLSWTSTEAGFMRMPYGISEPFGSRGGGPVRSHKSRSKPSVGLYSAFLEVPETPQGEAYLQYLGWLEDAVLDTVVANKVGLGMPLATKQFLKDAMHPLYKDATNSVFNDSLPGIRVKVSVGGKNAIRCTKNGALLKQGTNSLLTQDCIVDPTWSIRGIWVFQGKWGIIVHMTGAEVVSKSIQSTNYEEEEGEEETTSDYD
jgi:hypothetical protein